MREVAGVLCCNECILEVRIEMIEGNRQPILCIVVANLSALDIDHMPGQFEVRIFQLLEIGQSPE